MAFEVEMIQGIKDSNPDWVVTQPPRPERGTDDVAEEIKSFYERVSKAGGSIVGSHVMLVTQPVPNASNMIRSDLYIVAEVPDSIEA